MDQADLNLSAADIERQLLASLCSPSPDEKARAGIFARLASHKFVSADHETIFQALLKMRGAPAAHIRETLGARLTRLGFPDIDVGPIFEIEPPSPDRIAALLDRLTP